MSHPLLLVTVWSVCHVSRGQALTESVTGGSDYLESSEYVSDFYDNSYDIPLLAPVVVGGEQGDEILGEVGESSIRDPYDILLSENNRDSSETDPYNVPILAPDTGSVSEPYDIPILSDNVILTEPEDQQETLPLVRERAEQAREVEEGDMCRLAGAGAESILLELPESRGEDHSQLTSPRQLPIMGQVSADKMTEGSETLFQVGRDISLELSFPSGNSIFSLDTDKVLHLTESLDRDQGDLSSVVFQV